MNPREREIPPGDNPRAALANLERVHALAQAQLRAHLARRAKRAEEAAAPEAVAEHRK
jgi:hypothetical protein